MNIYYYSSLDPTSPNGFRYDGSLYQGGPGLCAANPLVPSTQIVAAPYGPPAAGSRALDLVVAPSTVVSLLAPQVQSRNFCAGATYRMKTPYVIWPKLLRSRDRVDKSVRCEMCDMVLNSEQQAKQHFNGKHHLRRMRKLKVNSSASEEICSADLKYKYCKTNSQEKKMRTKKHHDKRHVESIADVSRDGDCAADEGAAPNAEDTVISRRPEGETDAWNLARLKDDGATTVEYAESADVRTNAVKLGKLDNADSEEELDLASDELLHLSHRSNNQICLTDSCSSSSRANCALIPRSCQGCACSSSSYSDLAPNRCSLLQNWALSTPTASCYSSPPLCDVLTKSSSQSSYVTFSVSSAFKMAACYSIAPSQDSAVPSMPSTSLIPGSLLPRP